MKKFLLALIFCLTFSNFSYSQYFGNLCFDCYSSIEVGAVASRMDFEGASSKTGFYLGYYSYSPLYNEDFAFRYGFSYNNIITGMEAFEDDLTIHAIQTPLILNYRITDNFQVFGGGELGFNIMGKYPRNIAEDPWYYSEDDDIFDFRENIKMFDASIAAGVGYILWDVMDINLKYNYGVTDIHKNEDFEIKKSMLSLSLAYTFRK